MTNTLTVEQLQELLTIQKEFDDRIPTLNLDDSKIAYVVEFFEWFNTLETFKNWKKKPGKPLETQLDELADLLAFGLSIANQIGETAEEIIEVIEEYFDTFDFKDNQFTIDMIICVPEVVFGVNYFERIFVVLAINIARDIYTIDDLITAYKKKMERNHARQNGTADKGKGYV
ncbi:dUTPase [Staphylococcus delphini]|uniref:dUTPase n=1 Tax=Staphylococcus delphini TaxID=53344 RepID=UPI0023B27DF5|nr:dUTPase [Staphylococcus delphini]MDE9798899.1 dUTPase [Staphylococcus delphini]MDE9806128.1 dUTPase [Staphylococcus delphini]